MAATFPSLMKYRNTQIQETQQTSSKINSETHAETHYCQAAKSQTPRNYLEINKRQLINHIPGILNTIKS